MYLSAGRIVILDTFTYFINIYLQAVRIETQINSAGCSCGGRMQTSTEPGWHTATTQCNAGGSGKEFFWCYLLITFQNSRICTCQLVTSLYVCCLCTHTRNYEESNGSLRTMRACGCARGSRNSRKQQFRLEFRFWNQFIYSTEKHFNWSLSEFI